MVLDRQSLDTGRPKFALNLEEVREICPDKTDKMSVWGSTLENVFLGSMSISDKTDIWDYFGVAHWRCSKVAFKLRTLNFDERTLVKGSLKPAWRPRGVFKPNRTISD